MKYSTLAFSVLMALGVSRALAQTNRISSVSIGTASTAGGTATGVAAVTDLIGTPGNQPGSVGNNLAGIQYVAGQIPLNGAPASIAFFALSGAAIPGGVANPAADFTSYGTLVSPTAVTTYADPASKLTAASYAGLTFAAADLGFGASDFYMIHHTPGTDYFSQMVPGTGTSTIVRDLKPMSWAGPTAGGPANTGAAGYFALAWATGILSAGAPYQDQSMYYLRTDANSQIQFGVMIPALTGASSDTINLTTAVGGFGVGGYTTLAFSPVALGSYGANQFYYLRQDTGPGGTGNTILGRLNPSLVAGTRTISDIANLGGVFTNLVFAADATGPAGAWGSNQLYISGALGSGAESISFAAIPNHNVGDVFTVTPTASSALDIDLTVVSGPATVSETGASGATPSSLRVFTVTATGPGVVTLQARQAGRSAPLPAYAANMLQQSFDVLGSGTVTSATSAAGTAGTPFAYTITGTGSPTSYSAGPLPAGLGLNSATGAITGTPTGTGNTNVLLGVTNASGTSNSTLVITVVAAGFPPTVVAATPTAGATAGTPFSYTITAGGSPTSFTATPLPTGLALNATTGVISGTPSGAGTTVVTLGATNGNGTGTTSLTLTVAAADVAPIITNPTAPTSGSVGMPFAYTIVAAGSPTSYTASPLPAGLTLNPVTGVITGSPTGTGTTNVTVTATNASGTVTSAVTITVAAQSASRISNFSGRAMSGPGSQTLIMGFAVSGDGMNLLVRGVGPGLATFGLSNFLADPFLTIYSASGAVVATNDNWGTSSSGGSVAALMAATAVQVGAFPLAAGSLDSGLLVTLNNGTGTTGLLRANTTPGVALVEMYDTGSALGTRLVNVSARMLVTSGDGVLIAGLGIAGNAPKTVLIRGVGPALAQFGVTGVLTDPMITVYSGSTVVASNAAWGSGVTPATVLSTTAALVGAFPLPIGSNDAALLLTLNPGAYTVQVTSVSGGTGVALVEVYDTQ